MNILFIGDIIGDPGLRTVAESLSKFRKEGRLFDFIIANVENSAGGFGVNKDTWKKLNDIGFDCMTSGNHIWNRPDAHQIVNEEAKLLRPANYPSGNPGFGWQIYKAHNDIPIAVINLQGRVYMDNIDCPFQAADKILEQLEDRARVIIVDFHADASSEKQALGWYLDGRVSAVVGTHTHVQTAEERILPRGTGFITDVGMCGPYDSIIGMEAEGALLRFLRGRPHRLKVASQNLKFAAVALDIDENDGTCSKIDRMLLDVRGIN